MNTRLQERRVIFSVNKVGGVRKNMDNDTINSFVKAFDEMEKDIKAVTRTFLEDYSVNTRLKNVGIISKQQAIDLGAVGPMLRASGVSIDTRKLGYAAYDQVDFEPIISNVGDSYARVDVRIKEIFQSIDIIKQLAAKMPDGEIETKFKGMPNGEYFCRVRTT